MVGGRRKKKYSFNKKLVSVPIAAADCALQLKIESRNPRSVFLYSVFDMKLLTQYIEK